MRPGWCRTCSATAAPRWLGQRMQPVRPLRHRVEPLSLRRRTSTRVDHANVFGFAKVTVNGRHQRPVANRNRGFHRPLPVPPSGRASHHDRTVVLGHRGEARLDVSTPGTITVAVRSTRHRRAVPPRRRSTPSIPSTRCGWSVQRGQHPAGAARVRQRAQQHVRLPAPRRWWTLKRPDQVSLS